MHLLHCLLWISDGCQRAAHSFAANRCMCTYEMGWRVFFLKALLFLGVVKEGRNQRAKWGSSATGSFPKHRAASMLLIVQRVQGIKNIQSTQSALLLGRERDTCLRQLLLGEGGASKVLDTKVVYATQPAMNTLSQLAVLRCGGGCYPEISVEARCSCQSG